MKKEQIKNFELNLRELNFCFGINWQNEEQINVFSGVGKFTINSLIKTYNLKNTNLNLLILQHVNYNGQKENKLVILNKFFEIELYENNFIRSFNQYYTKGEFETDRKTENIKYMLISVNPDNIGRIKKNYYEVQKETEKIFKNDDKNLIRIEKYKNVDFWRSVNNNTCGLSRFNDCKVNNITFDINLHYEEAKINNIYDYIDKSGYNVYLKRINLKRKATQIKAEKEKNQLLTDSTDYKKIADEITTDFKNKLIEISEELKKLNIEKPEDLQKFDFLVKILKDFQFNVNFYEEKIKNRIAQKDYKSLKEIEETIQKYKNEANFNIKEETQKKLIG